MAQTESGSVPQGHAAASGSTGWRPVPVNPAWNGMILFDGVCVFCSGWVRFVAERDGAQTFRFLPIQAEAGRQLAESLGIDADAPQSNVVVRDGLALFKSDAALAVLSVLPRWGWTAALRIVPRAWRDWLYDRIAGNRYRLFGRTEACWVPPPDLARRLRADAWTGRGP